MAEEHKENAEQKLKLTINAKILLLINCNANLF